MRTPHTYNSEPAAAGRSRQPPPRGRSREHVCAVVEVVAGPHRDEDREAEHQQREHAHDGRAAGVVVAPLPVRVARDAWGGGVDVVWARGQSVSVVRHVGEWRGDRQLRALLAAAQGVATQCSCLV